MSEKKEPLLNLKAILLSTTIPVSTVMMIISIWSRLSVEFGIYFMQAFHSIHPHPYTVTASGLFWYEHIFGVLFDLFYTAIDTAFLTGIIAILYNKFAAKDQSNK